MSLAGMWNSAIDSLKGDDAQEDFKNIICECRGVPFDYLKNVDCIFIPNDNFMLEVFGPEILEFDFYRDGECYWNNNLIFPVTDVLGGTCGIVGFNPFKYTEGEKAYSYSSSQVCQKSNFLFLPNKVLNLDEPIYIVDGLWDAIALSAHGFQGGACLGSTISEVVIMLLRACKEVVICPDNDEPGEKLLYKLKKKLPNLKVCRQSFGKDVDDAFKTNPQEMTERLFNTRKTF